MEKDPPPIQIDGFSSMEMGVITEMHKNLLEPPPWGELSPEEHRQMHFVQSAIQKDLNRYIGEQNTEATRKRLRVSVDHTLRHLCSMGAIPSFTLVPGDNVVRIRFPRETRVGEIYLEMRLCPE